MKITNIVICPEHGNALVNAALVHECRTDQATRDFVSDCLEAGLYESAYALWGEGLAEQCVACCYAFPHRAINDAVAAALVHRRCAGLSPALN